MHGDLLLLNRGEPPSWTPGHAEDGRNEHADEDDAAKPLAASHLEEHDAGYESVWVGDRECEDGGKRDVVPSLFQWILACRFHYQPRFHLLAHDGGFSFKRTFTFSHFHYFKKGFPVLAHTSD